jgi:DNA polymerase-1
VINQGDLPAVLQALDESHVVGADLETTGLSPLSDRARLLSLATDRGVYVIDLFGLADLPSLWGTLADKELIFHNGVFDLQFLLRLGFSPGRPVTDTFLLSQLLGGPRKGRGHHTLAACVERHLGKTLDKDLQASDWSCQLSAQQVQYAAADVEVLRPLRDKLISLIHAAGVERVAEIESRCLPAMAWMTLAGAPFDLAAWNTLAAEAESEIAALQDQLDQQGPSRPSEMIAAGWDWNSTTQVKELFAQLGFPLESTNDAHLASVNHPLARLLRDYRAANKRASTYGRDWIKHIDPDGRIRPKWWQIGADSGRMACSDPNLQNLPRDSRYRACFQAPAGRVLVKADYSQIELRIAAKIADDKAMIEAYRRGQDLHVLTAARLLGKGPEQVTKEDRQIAKSASFGLLYGMGARGYQEYAKNNYGVEMTQEQAEGYRQAFFSAYPGLKRWHRRTGSGDDQAIVTRTLTGRRRLQVARFTEKLNTPVQGTGADGLKLALALLWERRDQAPSAFPVLAVHDELVIEADADKAEAITNWLKTAMVDAMAPLVDPVPIEVEVKVARTWGGG